MILINELHNNLPSFLSAFPRCTGFTPQFTPQTSLCSVNDLLSTFHSTLRLMLTKILNVDLTEDQWSEALLLIHNGVLRNQDSEH